MSLSVHFACPFKGKRHKKLLINNFIHISRCKSEMYSSEVCLLLLKFIFQVSYENVLTLEIKL